MGNIYNFGKLLVGEFSNDKLNQNLTFAVAIAAGLLTVSALVTIFISLNKQQIIQKCKTLSWEMEDIINGDEKAYNKSNLKSKFILYERLLSEPVLLRFKPIFINFNNWAIILTVLFLIATIRIWLSIGYSLGGDIAEVTIVGVVLLTIFTCLMLTLISVRITGNLDVPRNILDGNKLSKIKTKDLCAGSSSLILKKENNILLGNININLPITNVEILPLLYGFSYDKTEKEKSIKAMDFLCTPYFPNEEEVKFSYTSQFQKKVIVVDEAGLPQESITGIIRIGDKLNPAPRNNMGMFSSPLYPTGYNYNLYFIDFENSLEENHTEMEVNISSYDEIEVYCYFRTSEGTTYVEYGRIEINKLNVDSVIELLPISISHNNIDFEEIEWERKVEFEKSI
ncbi:FUSC family protein [Bacillus mobilis]|uniref:FUSC family protein n=1 Tax=Bacillus mobilis TaxID=2026190 RepID=UPI0021CD24CD|nr:FUSC family protein [Bacillus mobilis]MCU5433567.1 FUSC family protein [Bacillus mobilis]